MEEFTITTNPSEMDFSVIHGYLSQVSYWANGIPESTMRKAMANSLCFAVLDQLKGTVGFARMVTDKATFAYLCDVFIQEHQRGKGLGKWFMQQVMQHPDLQGLRRMILATKDAHGLYTQVGFTETHNPNLFMEVWNPKVYSTP